VRSASGVDVAVDVDVMRALFFFDEFVGAALCFDDAVDGALSIAFLALRASTD
jgi:hypothetical protein